MNKKGDYKYGIILSLILGLMVLGLSLYFIFNEVWSEDDTDRAVCRQSIQLRSLLPESKNAGVNWNSFKDDFPLKCRTKVVEIGEADVEDAGRIIAENMVECWALYDNGDANAFPSNVFGDKSVCVPCARIHLTEGAKKKIGAKGINIENALRDLMMRDRDYSYYSHLMGYGKKFPAFSPASARPFDLTGGSFLVDEDDAEPVVLKNKLTGGKVGWEEGIGIWFNIKFSQVYLPKLFRADEGDLLINYGVIVSSSVNPVGDYVPYLFYFQTDQESSSFDEVKKKFSQPIGEDIGFCEEWEGIPA